MTRPLVDPFKVVRDFEEAVCLYTGAPYGVAVNSCTNAIFLVAKFLWEMAEVDGQKTIRENNTLYMPKFSYVGVPQSLKHAGWHIEFENELWEGEYQIKPFDFWDSARRFRDGMFYENGQKPICYDLMGHKYKCVSFHWSKILGIQQGGMILHNNSAADLWFRKARFDGRTEGVPPKDDLIIEGWHMYMSPEIAAEGLVRLMHLPDYNKDLPLSDYPDLSKMGVFK